MKQYLSPALALACAVLVIVLIVMKHGDDAQHETDAGAIADFSNRLDSAQLQIATGNGTILMLSNSLGESLSASLTFSNQLTEAKSTVALDTEQITSLNRQLARLESEKQALNQRLADLNSQMTNQVAGLTGQIASTQASLDQAYKDYGLLENRLRIAVAERMVVQRKFNNISQLQDRIQELRQTPSEAVSAQDIYAGLNVEVKSNGTVHVISPD